MWCGAPDRKGRWDQQSISPRKKQASEAHYADVFQGEEEIPAEMKDVKTKAYAAAKGLLDSIGLNVSYARPVRDATKLFCLKARELGASTVLDVGANVGQFATGLRRAGYGGTIVSFEPLSVAHAALQFASRRDHAWKVASRMALGETSGTAKINVSCNSVSSSLLQVSQRSVDAAPGSAFNSVEEVRVERLDDAIEPGVSGPFALKLDTQGFELHVLRGAPKTLDKTVAVVAEMSITSMYEEGASFEDVYRYLTQHGFRCITLTHGFADYARHELLQVDGVFVRS